jgi:glycosyltransferase involved in cell wall biosynthesis
MKAQVDVAVVITTFNHARFLGEAIESVLAQTAKPAEIVVVDDGSDDDPESVVRNYGGVRLVRQPNRGLAAARNTGWRAVSSSFVAFLDADDWLRPNCLDVGLRQLDRDPHAAFTYGAYANHFWPSGRIVEVPFRPVPPRAFAAMLRRNPIGMHATVLYRRSSLEMIGGFGEELRACEDYDLYLRLSALEPVTCCPELVADYRQHDSNMSRDHALMLRAALLVMRRIAAEATARGVIDSWRAGVAEWKKWYVGNWARQARDRGLTRDVLCEAAALFMLAPAEMLRTFLSAVQRRMTRR